jgi:hypothetical protein
MTNWTRSHKTVLFSIQGFGKSFAVSVDFDDSKRGGGGA